MGMAIRIWRSSTALFSSSSPCLCSAVRKPAADISDSTVGGCDLSKAVGLVTFCSSSSTWSSWEASASSRRQEKKMTDRLSSVIDTVNDRELPLELRGQRNAVRPETDIINVVEQRIWHSMEEGQFEKLPGKGKPLNLDSNPHADPAEDTLYRILNGNGCAPEWVELNKEISCKVNEWRAALERARRIKLAGDQSEWNDRSEVLKTQLQHINNMVFRYNLIVPFGRQMFGLKWEKELDRLQE